MAATASTRFSYSTVELKDFEIGQCIGKGQFSSVYRTRCKLNQQLVALKKVQLYEMTDVKARYFHLQFNGNTIHKFRNRIFVF